MRDFPTIVFDLDGTLIHSAPDLHAAANVALAHLDRPALDLPEVTSFIGNGVETLVRRCLEVTGSSEPDLLARALAVYLDSYAANMTRLTRPYPGVVECLSALRDRGARLAVCTNKPDAPARAICDALGLSRYFDVIAGATPGVPKKPDAQPLLDTITRLGGTPETSLYVGDSGVDIRCAENAGVGFLLFGGGYLNAPPDGIAGLARFDDWATSGLV